MTGEKMVAIRKARGISRANLARELGVNQSTLWRYETGRRKIPTPIRKLMESIRDGVPTSTRRRRITIEEEVER